MCINVDKTKLIRFSRQRNNLNWVYALRNQALIKSDTSKYLGVTFSKDLHWGPHISSTVNKAYKALRFIMRVLGESGSSSKELAYKTLVRPILEFCSLIWDPHHMGNIHEVEMVQRTAARFV